MLIIGLKFFTAQIQTYTHAYWVSCLLSSNSLGVENLAINKTISSLFCSCLLESVTLFCSFLLPCSVCLQGTGLWICFSVSAGPFSIPASECPWNENSNRLLHKETSLCISLVIPIVSSLARFHRSHKCFWAGS